MFVYFATQAEHKYKCKYKYRIKTSKNNKKKKLTVPDRRTDKTREYKYKYTKSSKLHIIRTEYTVTELYEFELEVQMPEACTLIQGTKVDD